MADPVELKSHGSDDYGDYYYLDTETADEWGEDAAAGGRKFYNMIKPKFLGGHDPVAVSFWIISIAMVASTVFFIAECMKVKDHWKTSLTVGSLVTLVAAVHYFYMREYWVTFYASPTVYRYIDWTITVPLQMIEFYLILNAVGNPSSGIFYRLLIGTVVMLLAGYLGESGMINSWIGFIVGLAGWAFILFEVFAGEANRVKNDLSKGMGAMSGKQAEATQYAYGTMRFIVSVGWSIYPLGYYFGFLTGAVSANLLNFIYNVADLVNKICFCLAIWAAACIETDAGYQKM